MSQSLVFALDIVAILVLVFVLYFPRHRRRDMVVAFLGVNIGVVAVSYALSSSEVTAGLGLGLFGVLSIIRLRSSELDQQEIAYYFSALALGLLGGIAIGDAWLAPVLMAAIIVTMYIGDHPQLFRGYRVEVVTLDTAFTNERLLVAELERMFDATVHRVAIRRVNLVNDTTIVEVRYRVAEEDRSQMINGNKERVEAR